MRNVDIAELGIGRLTLLVFGLIVAAGLYCAFQIFPFYYYYWELENQMSAAIRVASTETDYELRTKLLDHIRRTEIPAKKEDLKIIREAHHMRIELKYQEVFYITWQGKDYDIKVFPFHARAEGDF